MARGGAAVKRVVLEVVGWVLVVAGIAALVLPGPGLLLLFGGLAVLSQQYEWAEKRVRPVERRALSAAADSVKTWPRIIMSLLGACWLIAVGVLWLLQPAVPEWWSLRASWWLIGGWPTGVTLIGSGLIALGMIVYSFRRFRGEDAGGLTSRQDQRELT